jgi:hypothetical protein
MLLVEGSSPEESIVIGPKADSVISDAQRAAAAGSEIVLFGRGGSQLTAHFGAAALKQDGDCTVWPLKDVRGDGPTRGWSIGFISRSVKPVALDSVDILTPRDSMTLVAEVSRLASAVTAPSDPAFQGLRFTVHDIRRFESAPGTAALVAHVIRRVNQEANPQEEQTLLIAERDSGVVSGPYRLVYAERTWGLEDRVTTPEVIGAAQYGGHPSLIVARDNEAGVAYAILQRVAAGRWAIRWTSSPTSCG